MVISKNKIFIAFISIMILSFLLITPVFAQMQTDTGNMEQIMTSEHADGTMGHNMGPMIAGRMLHAWVSLAAAIIIFFLALKYMTGGKLSRPIMLIGFGALGDSLIGLTMTPTQHMQWMWLAATIFSVSVVIGILWMGSIFGVFQSAKATSQTNS